LNGTILDATKNFLDSDGYKIRRSRGKTPPNIRKRNQLSLLLPAYCAILGRTSIWVKHKMIVFKRITNSNKEVWIQAGICAGED